MPNPPACIAKAIATLDWNKPHDDSVISHQEYAQAVWDALLTTGYRIGAGASLTTSPDGHVLVIPLGDA